jgi:sodium-independent sulfate anion transporter 11
MLAPAVAGFMTGSAFTIATTQIPALLGISKNYVNSRDSAYKVVINTLKNLKHSQLDAAFGLSALFGLYFIRFSLDHLGKRYPQHRRKFFFANVMRNGIVVILITIASWLTTRHAVAHKQKTRISILKDVPRGFQHVGPLRIDSTLLNAMAPQIPVAVRHVPFIIPSYLLTMEHIRPSSFFSNTSL